MERKLSDMFRYELMDIYNSGSLLKHMSIQSAMPSNHLQKIGFPPRLRLLFFLLLLRALNLSQVHATLPLFYFEVQTRTVNKNSTW